MEGLATASAKQLPADSPAVPLLRVVTGNLATSPDNEKFRRIKLSGKAGQKLTAEPAAMTVLTMMGFRKQTEDGEDFFVVDKLMPSCVSAVAAALAPAAPAPPRPAPAALNADGTPKASSCCAPREEKLSTKQEARRLVEEQEKKQRQAAKRHREETKAQIKQDNHVRKHDENWTTKEGVTKGGKDINTFRGKYGEDQGGG